MPADQDILDVMQKTKSKRKHKRDLVLDEAQQEAIRQKIAASMARKAAKTKFNCPACGVTLTRIENVLTHMARCCEDLLQPEVLQQVRELAAGDDYQYIVTASFADAVAIPRVVVPVASYRTQISQVLVATAG